MPPLMSKKRSSSVKPVSLSTQKTSKGALISFFDLLMLKPSLYYGCLITIVLIHFAPLWPRVSAFVKGVFLAIANVLMLVLLNLLNAVKVDSPSEKGDEKHKFPPEDTSSFLSHLAGTAFQKVPTMSVCP